MRTTMAWLAIGLMASSAAAAATAIEERMSASAADAVEVVNQAGKVRVTGGDEAAVTVTGTLGEDTLGLEFERDGHRIVVAVRYPEKRWGHRMDSDLYITLPADADLVVRSVSADVEVRELRGEQRLQTISGTLRTTAYAADLDLRSVSGNMTIAGDEVSSVLNVSTVSGDLEARGISGRVEASSVSGDLDLVAGILDRGRFKSTSGDIEVRTNLAPKGSLTLESTSGDVDLVVPDANDLAVEVETFSGRLKSCFGPAADAGHGPAESLRFSRGAGDRSVRITSFSGDVGLCDARKDPSGLQRSSR